MPYVNNPRYGEDGQPRQIFEHERAVGVEYDPGMARFIVVLFGLALVPWLYPVTGAALLAVGAGSAAVAGEGMRLDGAAYALAVALPVLVVLVVLMRLEQRLGTLRIYRWSRHVVRVLIPAVLLHLIVREETGSSAPFSASFADSSLLGGTIAVMVVAQLILWAASWLRADWHASLVKLRMRSPML